MINNSIIYLEKQSRADNLASRSQMPPTPSHRKKLRNGEMGKWENEKKRQTSQHQQPNPIIQMSRELLNKYSPPSITTSHHHHHHHHHK
ncbi:hypothetical protein M434DRAFT_268689 [Hypoxylon sp. CO27-5]|nr:hypothetical protein M434DRAFT_268689 [Hypoxylon sp. CO27-5]